MRTLEATWITFKVLSQAKRNKGDSFGWLLRRPFIFAAIGWYEFALLFSMRMDPKLKELAGLKAAALINCEFCIDIGSALAHSGGVTEQQLLDLPRYRTSDAYSDDEKLVIEFAEALTKTPATDIDDIRARLLQRFSKGQVTELASAIVFENHRARLNQALGIRPTGMADGMVCILPERPQTQSNTAPLPIPPNPLQAT